MNTKTILAAILVTVSFASNAQFGPSSSRTPIPRAEDAKFDPEFLDPDYRQAGIYLSGFSCNGNARLLETPPEIAAVAFKRYNDDCNVSIIYKKSYKIDGKSFHIVDDHNGNLSVAKFTMNRRNK